MNEVVRIGQRCARSAEHEGQQSDELHTHYSRRNYHVKGDVMTLATWWRGDTVPTLPLLAGFHVEAARDEYLIAQLNRLTTDEVHQRIHTGHQPYLAYVQDIPVGY